jgi:hypothetical protein
MIAKGETPTPATLEAMREQITPHPKLYKDVAYEVTLPHFDCAQCTHKLEVAHTVDLSHLAENIGEIHDIVLTDAGAIKA